MEISKLDRLKLSNQYLILEKLYPAEADYFSKQRKIVQEGYIGLYKNLFSNIDSEVSTEVTQEVLDILNMYRAITYSYQKIVGNKDIPESKYIFRGFDGNEEVEHLAFAEFFIFDMNRFPELRYGNEHADINSHCSSLNRYRRMLKRWNGKNNLTMKQIDELFEA